MTSSGRRLTWYDASATRAARLAERTAAKVAMARTSVPNAVARVATVAQASVTLDSRPTPIGADYCGNSPGPPDPTWQTREMLAHLSIQCADLPRSAAFYDAALAPLGVSRVMEVDDHAIGYGVPPLASFWIGRQQTGDGFRETHFAFAAPTRAAVRAFYDAAVRSGAEVLHEPQLWPQYDPDYYGAFVRDPDGNNVEAVCHSPA